MNFEKIKAIIVASMFLFIVSSLVFDYFFGIGPPPLSAISHESKTKVIGYMEQFCADTFGEQGCRVKNIIGKQRWVITATFTMNAAIHPSVIESWLVEHGWKRSKGEYENGIIYCKGTYGAIYFMLYGAVQSLTFQSATDECREAGMRN